MSELIENYNGELITKLDNGIMVTVSKWIEGESLDKLEMISEYCSHIGELTAALHRCAKGFQGFPVIAYDGQQCARIKESFEPFCSGERLFADDFYLIHAGG